MWHYPGQPSRDISEYARRKELNPKMWISGGDQAFSGLVGKDPQAQQSYYRVPLPPDRKLSFTAEFSTSPAQTAGQI